MKETWCLSRFLCAGEILPLSPAARSGSMKGHDALALPRLIAFAELTWQPPGTDRQQPAGPEPSIERAVCLGLCCNTAKCGGAIPSPFHGTLANASS